MADQPATGGLARFAQIAQAASAISVIVGICVALFAIFNNIESMRLAALTSVNDFVKEDNDARDRMGKFQAAFKSKDEIDKLIKDYGCAELAYDSENLADLRVVGRHYERIGALVRLHYVNFDLIYEVIPFPDTFWDETEGFRNAARNGRWTADGKSLPDFWKNFAYLHSRYEQKRKKEAAP